MICSLCPHAHTCRYRHIHTRYASKEEEKSAPKAVPGSRTYNFDLRQTAGAKGGEQLAIPPPGRVTASLPLYGAGGREGQGRLEKKGARRQERC